jgi:hypothetical protein
VNKISINCNLPIFEMILLAVFVLWLFRTLFLKKRVNILCFLNFYFCTNTLISTKNVQEFFFFVSLCVNFSNLGVKYVILIIFPLLEWLHNRASLSRYTYGIFPVLLFICVFSFCRISVTTQETICRLGCEVCH